LNTKILVGIVVAVMLLSVMGLLLVADQDDGATGEFVVVDDRGELYRFDEPAERITSLAKPLTQILIEIGAGDKLVGVDTFSVDLQDDYPGIDLEDISLGASAWGVNAETVLATEPDVVLIYNYGSLANIIKTMEGLGLKVLAFTPESYGAVYELVGKMGDLSGKTDEAADAMELMASTKTTIDEAVKDMDEKDKPRVYFELGTGTHNTVNQGSITDVLISMAGGVNAARNETMGSHYKPSKETVVSWDVDIIIVEEKHPESDANLVAKYDNPSSPEPEIFRLTHGYNTYDLNLVKGLMQMAEYLHPDLFDFS